MPRQTTIAILATLMLSSCVRAQTADEILERNFKALGGRARLHAVRTLRIEATEQRGGKSEPVKIFWRRPDKLRIESPYEGLDAVQVFDGTNAWYTYPGLPDFETQILEGAEREALKVQADLVEGPTFDYAAKGHRVELLGKDKLGDGETWRLLLTTAEGDVRTLWFDAHSMLEVREERKEKRGEKEVTVESTLSDFRPAGGILVAHHVEDRVEGSGEVSVFTIQKLEVDVDLPDALFQAPAPRSPAPDPPPVAPPLS